MVASWPKVIIWAAASLQNLHHLWPKGYHKRKKTGLFTCDSIAPLQLGIHFKPCTPFCCWPFATFALNGIKQLSQVVEMWIQGVIFYLAFPFHPEYWIHVSFPFGNGYNKCTASSKMAPYHFKAFPELALRRPPSIPWGWLLLGDSSSGSHNRGLLPTSFSVKRIP